MDDTPYINDGADASLRKTVSLLNKIEAHTASAGGGGLTNAELRASPVPVDIGGTGSITITSGTVTVSNEVEVTNSTGNPIPVSGPLTNTQLRATAVPVSGTVTANTGLTQPLTNAELRASDVPVTGQVNSVVKYSDPDYGYVEVSSDYRLPVNSVISGGSIEVNNLPNVPTNVPYDNYAPSAGTPIGATYNGEGDDYFRPLTVDSQNRLIVTGSVTGPLTDTQLRATAVPVSGTFWPATQPVSLSSAISQRVQGWDIPIHDYRALGYTSGNLTSVTYKTGGASGTTVATLTLGYDGSGNLTSITKS